MRLDVLLIRMGEVRLINMLNGYEVLSKINDAIGETAVTIEMSGKEISVKVNLLPLRMKDQLNEMEVIAEEDEVSVLVMLDREIAHMAEIARHTVQIVEGNLRSIVYVSFVFLLLVIALYRIYIGEFSGTEGFRVEGFIQRVIELLYENKP